MMRKSRLTGLESRNAPDNDGQEGFSLEGCTSLFNSFGWMSAGSAVARIIVDDLLY